MNPANSPEPAELSDASDTLPADEEGHPGALPFPIVGIGASAGGLEAITQLLEALPVDTGPAFVLIQHLDPRHESQLAAIVSRTTRMPVLEATHGMPVSPDHVYVIPHNTSLTLARGLLQLTPRGKTRGLHLPVDTFFRSLALDQQAWSIGVILSGSGSDGTLGLAEIKAAGGITFAQQEASAQHAGMPHSAIASGCVDFILPPQEIARELARIGRHPYLIPQITEGSPPVAGAEEHFQKILGLLRASFGVDFTHYRDTTIQRRIRRRTALYSTNLAEYAQRLNEDPSETEALYHDLLINVTSFFRDPELFDALKSRVWPEIARSKSPGASIRVWVAGCSTGQEAYSLAISLLEFQEEQSLRLPIQIFATDLSDAVALTRARTGLYPESIEQEVSPDRLRRFFTKEAGGYRITKSIRDLCVVARHNVAADPPFSRVDLVSCRNVLIYLAPTLQRRVIPTFHYALNPAGYLVLGSSETVGKFSNLFDMVDRKHKIYTRKATAARLYPYFQAEETPTRPLAGVQTTEGHTPTSADWLREADRIALSHYVPPGVLVNDELEILQFRGKTSPYLEPAPGEASFNLVKMAREGLFLHLRGAIDEARAQNTVVRRQGVRIRNEGIVREIALQVIPVRLPGSSEGCFLVLFEEDRPTDRHEPADASPTTHLGTSRTRLRSALPSWLQNLLALPQSSLGSRSATAQPADTPGEHDREVAVLGQELAAAKEYLQSIIEQKEAANEDLKAANEEILSSNEELQSTNEELETAKEEIQSVNEELSTVNDQLDNRNHELSQTNDDLANLLGSSHIPLVMLGVDLRIRRFTAPAQQLLGLLPPSVGRPIGEIEWIGDTADLEAMVQEVIDTARLQEREIRGQDGRWYMLRIHPYQTADRKIDGAVLVVLDIHEVKSAQEQIREARDYAEAIVETVREPLLVLGADLRVHTANRSFYNSFQVSPRETEGKLIYELGDGQWDISTLRTMLDEILPANTAIADFPIEHVSPGIGKRSMLLNARRLQQSENHSPMILVAIEDVTAREQAEAAQRFLADVSAELASLDYETTLMSLARRAVPALADCCFFDVVTADKRIERVGWAHADPARQELFDAVGRFVPPSNDRGDPVSRVLLTGRPVFEPKVTDTWLQAIATSPEHLQFLQALDVRSLMTVPLMIGERKLGALTCCYSGDSGRHHTRAELALAEELARRAAMVVENARLYHALQDADRRKDEFLAMLAHELRNPLAPIRNAAALLKKLASSEPRAVRAVDAIDRQVSHQARLLDDLLDVSRIRQGKVVLRTERLDLNPLIRNAVEDRRSVLEEAGLTLTVELPEAQVWVEGDPTRLSQVVGNLLNNSTKFTDRGGRVAVQLEVDAACKRALITVRDTGIGIDPQMLPHVFETFAQADRSLDRTEGGMGLGLALVKGLVEAHEGEVRAASEGEGRGAEFTILLPIASAPAPSEKTTPSVPSARANRILIVEDNRDAAETLGELLAMNGYTVSLACSGPEAVALARQFRPDVVLCDLGLPGMDGYRVAAALQQDPVTATARLIAVSGYGQSEDRQRSREAGFELHLTKPVDPGEVVRLLGGKEDAIERWPV